MTVGSQRTLSKAAGISGRLDVWRRDGVLQVLLAGHPLYTFTVDHKRNVATGEGIRSFGGVWHVIKASAGRRTTSHVDFDLTVDVHQLQVDDHDLDVDHDDDVVPLPALLLS